MWRYHAMIALDLARERTLELHAEADRRRLSDQVRRYAPSREPRPNRLRRTAAAPLRAFGSAAHALSSAACVAATRIEGRTA